LLLAAVAVVVELVLEELAVVEQGDIAQLLGLLLLQVLHLQLL
jgi:hypothetical protein